MKNMMKNSLPCLSLLCHLMVATSEQRRQQTCSAECGGCQAWHWALTPRWFRSVGKLASCHLLAAWTASRKTRVDAPNSVGGGLESDRRRLTVVIDGADFPYAWISFQPNATKTCPLSHFSCVGVNFCLQFAHYCRRRDKYWQGEGGGSAGSGSSSSSFLLMRNFFFFFFIFSSLIPLYFPLEEAAML